MSETAKKATDWATFFYQELGYPIVENEETNNALNKAMEKAFNMMLEAAEKTKSTVAIRVLNDTRNPLTVRLLPPNTGLDLKPKVIEPLKMAAVFLKDNKVFLKIWDGNTILLCEDGFRNE